MEFFIVALVNLYLCPFGKGTKIETTIHSGHSFYSIVAVRFKFRQRTGETVKYEYIEWQKVSPDILRVCFSFLFFTLGLISLIPTNPNMYIVCSTVAYPGIREGKCLEMILRG